MGKNFKYFKSNLILGRNSNWSPNFEKQVNSEYNKNCISYLSACGLSGHCSLRKVVARAEVVPLR